MSVTRAVAVAFCMTFAASDPAAAHSKAFVLTTDFTTGSLSAVDLDSRAVRRDVVGGICSDAALRWFDGLLYVVNRLGCDNVLVLDPANGFAPVRQFSVGNGSNPQDILVVSPAKAYVTRYELGGLLIVNPQTGGTLGQISLADFADADGIPEMARMTRVGNRVFVSVQRLDRNAGFQPADSSLVVVIDAGADTILDANPALPGKQAIRLPGTNPVTAFGFDRSTSRLLIGCAGRFGVPDGGIAWIDPTGLAAAGYAVTEAALGGDVLDVAWLNADRSYAIINDPSFNTCLVSWSAVTGQRIATIFCPGGFRLADCELNDRGELYVCDNDLTTPGLYVFSAATGQIVAGPLDTGLPPFQVIFDGPVDPVSVAAPPATRPVVRGPRPNPASLETRFFLTLARPEPVRIEVFDPAGRRVRTLEHGVRPAGPSEITWDLRDRSGHRVEPGFYLVRARIAESDFVLRLSVVY